MTSLEIRLYLKQTHKVMFLTRIENKLKLINTFYKHTQLI